MSVFFILFIISCGTDTNTKNIKKLPIIDLPELTEDISKLGINDILEISVYGEPELLRTYRIDSSGKITYPLIGSIQVFGRNQNEITKEIEDRLKEKHFKNPQVTIFLKESNSKKVYVLGQINKAGAYNYLPKMTILQLIATGGGFTSIANRNGVVLKRTIKNKEHSVTIPIDRIISGDLKDIILIPNDIVYVPESWL
ncbi:polysaccharide export protein [bacterium]|nr:polysaccharide export protein [bacterium]